MTKTLTLDIQLQEPLLATGLEGDPNAATGLNYIPGSLIRGAAIGRYKHGKEALEAEFRRLFLDGTTRFLNAYPVINATRTLPCPRSLMRDKYRQANEKTVYDLAIDENINPNSQWQSVGSAVPFINLRDAQLMGCRPSRTIQVHTNRNRRLGRAIEGDGAVFRYESISANQLFRSHVLCERNDVNLLLDLLEASVCLGGSRTAGYGHVTTSVHEETGEWSETDPAPLGGSVLRITLLSDAIVCEPNTGQHSTSSSAILAAIDKVLGTANDPATLRSFVQATTVGGFNRKWGLPLQQTVAVAMGSVVVIPTSNVSSAAIRQLVEHGIGQRRAEGFGRLAVNWQQHSILELDAQAIDEPLLNPGAPQQPIPSQLMVIQNRLQKLRIEREINSRAWAVSFPPVPIDCRSRVQNLRIRVMNDIRMNAEAFSSQNGIRKSIEELNDRKTVRQKYDKIRVLSNRGRMRLLDWLTSYLQDNSIIRVTIPELSSGQSKELQLSGSHAYQFRLKVVYIVLGRLIKESKSKSGRNREVAQS